MARVLLLAGQEALTAVLSAAGHIIVTRLDEPHDLIVAPAPIPGSRRPVIVYTHVGNVEERIRALDMGAADAFDAGFAPSQMAARVGAVVRREVPDRIDAGGCVVDLGALTATREGRTSALTPREVEIVRWLHRHAQRIVTRGELLQNVWGVSPDNTTRAVDVAISALRAKIEENPKEPKIIQSTKGAGYRWVA